MDKNKVWEKGNIIKGRNPNLFRKDDFGKTIFKPSYGKSTEMGWAIEHIRPKSRGGTDHIRNLRPVNINLL